jgi:hypothetical protein
MKELMIMRTTLNLSAKLVKEVESLYGAGNRSKAIEKTLEEAVRLKKLRAFMDLKGRVDIDEEVLQKIRGLELPEYENNC